MKYTAKYDMDKRIWRVVDVTHASIQSLKPDEDIPDDSPAMKILDNEAVNALVIAVKKQFPGKFEVQYLGVKDNKSKIKDLIVDLFKSSNKEELMVKALVLESLLKRLDE